MCSGPCSRSRSRSEEHTSELQSQFHLVCRLLLEKKNAAVIGTSGFAINVRAWFESKPRLHVSLIPDGVVGGGPDVDETYLVIVFFFNHTPTTEIYTLSLHDALPIFSARCSTERLIMRMPSSRLMPWSIHE